MLAKARQHGSRLCFAPKRHRHAQHLELQPGAGPITDLEPQTGWHTCVGLLPGHAIQPAAPIIPVGQVAIEERCARGDPGFARAEVAIIAPENPVTRAEMALFLLRAKHSAAHSPPPPLFPIPRLPFAKHSRGGPFFGRGVRAFSFVCFPG